MNPSQISDFFAARREKGEDLVLATVVETAGSTYSKAGTYMIIDNAGNFRGMLSGGCLEGDLAERAARVLESGDAAIAEYNLGADDELFGLGVGCEGTMRILLQPLNASSNYEPFQTINDLSNGHAAAKIALVVASDAATVKPGAATLLVNEQEIRLGVSDDFAVDFSVHGLQNYRTGDTACQVLVFEIHPTPRLLILGAGMDSEPIVGLASELGWRCTIQDHRPSYIEGRNLPSRVEKLCMPAAEVSQQIELADFDLAMIMSHHLATDTEYLRQLASTNIGYVGLLGPPHRRDRILASASDAAAKLAGRLHGPAGIDLGGRGPGPIALSIIAEMQRYLASRATGE
ncbi:MAG: XdhC family protein [Pseudomonadota bacterium]